MEFNLKYNWQPTLNKGKQNSKMEEEEKFFVRFGKILNDLKNWEPDWQKEGAKENEITGYNEIR